MKAISGPRSIVLSAAGCAGLLLVQASAVAGGPALDLGPVVRNGDGQVASMTRVDAEKQCDFEGARLPTIRELAAILNPDGVADAPKQGFLIISPADEAPFYYNFNAYRAPTGEEAAYKYWSASNSAETAAAEKFGFVFWAASGSVDESFSSTYRFAEVRCVRTRAEPAAFFK